jgi:hypothetical protein
MTTRAVPAGWTHCSETIVARGELDALPDARARERFAMLIAAELEPPSLANRRYEAIYWCEDKGAAGVRFRAFYYPPRI